MPQLQSRLAVREVVQLPSVPFEGGRIPHGLYRHDWVDPSTPFVQVVTLPIRSNPVLHCVPQLQVFDPVSGYTHVPLVPLMGALTPHGLGRHVCAVSAIAVAVSQ